MLYVGNVTKLPLLKAAKVKAGKDSLANKKVEWVSVIESPVENFVRENEFVLSTGIGCSEDIEVFLEFVKDVYDSGASALAIATGRYIFDIPKEIIQYAQEQNFIIIEIPWEIRFADIVHEVMRKLSQLHQNELERTKDIQQQLMQMVLEGKSLTPIANCIEQALGQTILIFNKKGEAVAGSANYDRVLRLWGRLTNPQSTLEVHHPLYPKMRMLTSEGDKLHHVPIQSNGIHEGELFILTGGQFQLEQLEINIIEHAILASALWFSHHSVKAGIETRLQNDFLLRLIKGEKMAEKHIQSHAELFHFNIDIPYDCIVGYSENLDSIIKQDLYRAQTKEIWLERMIVYIKEEFQYAADAVQHKILFANEGDFFIIFLEATKKSASDTINHFLDLVERKIIHLLPGVTFSWGIGKHSEGIRSFHQSFQKAKSALDMGRTQIGIGKRRNFEETRINRLLLSLAINEEVQEITASTISPLVEYDEKRDMDLINTVIAYNKNNGNVSQTARELNLHRQSLLYRLRKIESLTRLSLINPDDLFLLDFSIKIWSTGAMNREIITKLF